MTRKELAKTAHDAICRWAQNIDKIVIAIDGYTGVGKTTLLTNLTRLNPDIIPIHRDDFLFARRVIDKKLAKADDRSVIFEREVCDDQKMVRFVLAFRNGERTRTLDVRDPITGEITATKTFDLSKPILVVEGVFMFHPELPLNKLWDKRIYLEGDIAKIDARRIAREKKRWGNDYFPETHPDSYFRQVTLGLKRYIGLYKPEKAADLVLYADSVDK